MNKKYIIFALVIILCVAAALAYSMKPRPEDVDDCCLPDRPQKIDGLPSSK